MLFGRSNPMAYLRIYLDNAPVLLVRPDDDGNWKTLLSNVDPGVYTLRIDQVNEPCSVTLIRGFIRCVLIR